jgi:hypothetical protein
MLQAQSHEKVEPWVVQHESQGTTRILVAACTLAEQLCTSTSRTCEGRVTNLLTANADMMEDTFCPHKAICHHQVDDVMRQMGQDRKRLCQKALFLLT